MNKKILFGAVILLIVSSLCLGLIFKQDKVADIKVPCFNNNSYCSVDAQCNITISYPNGTILVDNGIMTNNISFHNYTLNTNLTSLNGDYSTSIVCNDVSNNGFSTFTFKITPSGTEPSTAQGIVYLILIAIAIILLLLCVFFAWSIDGKNEYDFGGGIISVNYNKYVKQGLWLFSYIFLIVIAFFTWQMANQFLFLDFMTGFLRLTFIVLVLFFLPLFLLIFWFTFMKAIADMRLWELAKRNLKPR